MKGCRPPKATSMPFIAPAAAPNRIAAANGEGYGNARRHQCRGHDGRHGGGRAHRQVDAAADDDERHAERHAGIDRRLLQDVDEVALGQEVRRQRREDGDDDDKAEESADIAQAEVEGEGRRGAAAVRLLVEDMGSRLPVPGVRRPRHRATAEWRGRRSPLR